MSREAAGVEVDPQRGHIVVQGGTGDALLTLTSTGDRLRVWAYESAELTPEAAWLLSDALEGWATKAKGRAMRAPCPTCSGLNRETVGLVCQTCGKDYGAADRQHKSERPALRQNLSRTHGSGAEVKFTVATTECPDDVCGDHYDPTSDDHCPVCHA